MHESNDAYRLLDNLNTAVLRFDGALELIGINSAAEALLSLSKRQAVGLGVDALVSESPLFATAVRRGLADRCVFTERDMHVRVGDGRNVVVDCTVVPIVDGEEIGEVLVELTDVDRMHRIVREESALTHSAVANALIRGMAHEIKNPLGGIRGAAQLLERELEAPGLKEYTRIIVEEVDRLRSLIDRMLAPRTSAEPDGLNIHEVLEHVRGLVEAECDGARAIAVDYDPSLPEIRGVRDHLVQVFLNVVRNAAEAARPGGRVVIRTRAQRLVTIGVRLHKLALRVDVVDDGPGVPVELGQSIFYPMVSGRADGTGLGLAIAQSLVHRHGGMIEFESRPGETAFTVYIPLGNEH